jgi:hypothetical protein
MKKPGAAHQLVFSQTEELLTVFSLKFKPRSIKPISSNHNNKIIIISDIMPLISINKHPFSDQINCSAVVLLSGLAS